MLAKRIKASYLIETSFPPDEAAEVMAGEQSCGTFIKTPGESDHLRRNHRATVENIEILETVGRPTLSGARIYKESAVINRARVTLSWPIENIGYNLPNLVSTIAGNLFELAPFSGLRLLDFDIPGDFAEAYPGPAHGIAGTRSLVGVYDRPIIGTIIKPSVGLTPSQTAQQTKRLIEAGLDFIKDDELMGDPPHSPFDERVGKVMEVIDGHAQRTGKKAMYAFNLSGDIDDMLNRHDYLVQMGATCAMVNLNAVGISAVEYFTSYSQLPVHGHRNGWGMLTRCDVLGMDYPAYQKIWRLAGVDHMHTNGIRNKFCESDESVIRSIRSCLAPFADLRSPMPVLSSGQWAGQTVDTFAAIDSTDLMYLCGGGIVGHPAGMEAGVKSIIQGWEAALSGKSLEEYAKDHVELEEALAFFSNKT
ncbi:MAG: ribulose 1,5-bisphosphate carboxylase [Saprospiraceae bacterium]|nr:ribulose 1,5-bisphosphate carboxylase [Saprospiraceae bacterium]